MQHHAGTAYKERALLAGGLAGWETGPQGRGTLVGGERHRPRSRLGTARSQRDNDTSDSCMAILQLAPHSEKQLDNKY